MAIGPADDCLIRQNPIARRLSRSADRRCVDPVETRCRLGIVLLDCERRSWLRQVFQPLTRCRDSRFLECGRRDRET